MNKTIYRYLSSATASITKIRRTTFMRKYPTLLVFPDGSTINIRYHQPRAIITMPLDINTLTENEKKARIRKRRPIEKARAVVEVVSTFDPTNYFKKVKKKP